MKTILEKVSTICMVLVAILLWVLGSGQFLHWVTNGNHQLLSYLFFSCLMAPLGEEYLYRHFPIQATLKLKPELLNHTIIFSAIIFGLAHGHGWWSVIWQGATGLGITYVYIKNGYSYWSAVITHSAWNIICLFLN